MKIFLQILGMVLFSTLACAQHTNVLVVNYPYTNEPSIFIDPNNTNRMMAGTNISDYHFSDDGGYTWQSRMLTSDYGVAGDPCIVADGEGNFYYLHLSINNQGMNGGWLDRIVCQRTSDLGATWTVDSYMGFNGTADQDKEWMVVDYRNNNLYVTWTQFDKYGSANPADSSNIMFSKSTDLGITWSPAKRINQVAGNCLDDGNTTEGAVPAVGPAGEVYVSWAGPEGIVFNKSLDEGNTWLENDIFVADNGSWAIDIPGISRSNGLPITCCNLAEGDYHGDIYINWADQSNGVDDTDIWFSKSTDGGITWSERKRVNNDPPGKHQFFTWMTIDRVTGYIWIVFYDRRHYDDNNTDVYMAVSKDGGENFQNFKVSERPFLPYSSVFFGDYTNVSAHNNVVRPIWNHLDGESAEIITAIVDVDNLDGVGEQERMPFSLEQNMPNPFHESTFISFHLRQAERVSLQVYDAYGRLMATLINNQLLDSGKYTHHFDAKAQSLAPGLYYFKLFTSNKALQRKMLVL